MRVIEAIDSLGLAGGRRSGANVTYFRGRSHRHTGDRILARVRNASAADALGAPLPQALGPLPDRLVAAHATQGRSRSDGPHGADRVAPR